jgi:hypothetical protein
MRPDGVLHQGLRTDIFQDIRLASDPSGGT